MHDREIPYFLGRREIVVIRYCQRCILPDTRPGLELGTDGICSACRGHEKHHEDVDWEVRREQFGALVDQVRSLGRPYDCVIPVSGGKDSTWQTVVCLEHGLHPLAVTWKTPARTDLGARNLENLVELGVDHIDFQINPRVERRLVLEALVRFGTPALPMHLALFNIPLTIGARFDTPLVVWGENSATEYSGSGPESESFTLDAAWLRKYGVAHGTTAADWVSDELSAQDLTPYFGPSDEELSDKGVKAVFLGHFFEWDPERTAQVAREHGFTDRSEGPVTGYYAFADIDDAFLISVHHWLKWFKFGFTRTYDNLSLEIRNGRMTRDEAVEIIRERGDETPVEDIEELCSYLEIPSARFYEIAEGFRDPDVWVSRNGGWEIDDFLIPDWSWDREASRGS